MGRLLSKWDKAITVIKKSLMGENIDFTKESIPSAVVLLAIPMILELSLESVFALVDMFFVSKLGAAAMATVGLTESVLSLVYASGMGLGMGVTAIVARRVGEKNFDGASHAGAQSIIIAAIISAILGVLGVVYSADILKFMGGDEQVIREGTIFTQITFGGSAAIILLFLINGIFRGAGNAAMAMKSLWLASILNIILCPICIHFFGLKGAAIATLVGRSSGVAYQLYHLFKSETLALKILPRHFGFDFPLMKNIIHIAWPAGFQFVIGSGSWIFLAKLVAETGGTDASAGYQVALRNVVFFILPAWGLSNAAATLVGQNLGAKEFLRAEESVKLTAKYNAIFMAGVTLLFVLFAENIISIFTTEPAVLEHGALSLRVIGSAYIFYGIGMVMAQALNGAGDTRTPTWINIFGFWIFQIPFAYFLAKSLNMGALGAFVAIPIAETIMALMAWYYFRKGKWKEVKV